MTLIDMCNQAALLSDRADEFVKETGETAFEDDALNYFNIFKGAINEAYRAISKKLVYSTITETVTVPTTKLIDLNGLTYPAYKIRAVMNADQTAKLAYNFIDRNTMEVFTDGTITLTYHYLPDDLADETDEPIFPDAQADPMIYISLAVSRVFKAEKKFDSANQWMNDYYQQLSTLASMQGGGLRRVARRTFR